MSSFSPNSAWAIKDLNLKEGKKRCSFFTDALRYQSLSTQQTHFSDVNTQKPVRHEESWPVLQSVTSVFSVFRLSFWLTRSGMPLQTIPPASFCHYNYSFLLAVRVCVRVCCSREDEGIIFVTEPDWSHEVAAVWMCAVSVSESSVQLSPWR